MEDFNWRQNNISLTFSTNPCHRMDAHWKQSEFIIFPKNILLLENNNRNHFYNILRAPYNYFWFIPLLNKIYQYS